MICASVVLTLEPRKVCILRLKGSTHMMHHVSDFTRAAAGTHRVPG